MEGVNPLFVSSCEAESERGTEEAKREKEEILAKLSDTERKFAEGKSRVNKLEENNAKLCRAVEQSMTRLNRMSMDSDFLVDRFWISDEDKQRIDMWVDFLLKETEGKRGDLGKKIQVNPNEDLQGRSPNAAGVGSPVPYHGTSISGIVGPKFSPAQNYGPITSRGNLPPFAV